MEHSEFTSLFALLLLIIVFIYINGRYNNVFVKYIEKIVFYIREFFYQYHNNSPVCFPSSCIPVYKCPEEQTPCPPTPTDDPCKTSGNVINVNCGTGGVTTVPTVIPQNTCSPVCVDPCLNPCKPETKITFGVYVYVLSYLPGIIHKYKLNGLCQIDEQSKVNVTHNLGVLKRIYINNNTIYVEDCNSVIYPAVFNPLDGSLTF